MQVRDGLLLLVLAPWMSGCALFFPPPLPCPEAREISPPSKHGVYELKQPEEGADFGGEPKYVPIHPKPFAEDAWAVKAAAGAKLYRAPSVGSDPAHGGSVLVCSFAVGPTPGIDGIDGPTGPFVPISTPDLLVWADFAGQKVNKGPALGSSQATFAYRVNLNEGDLVRFGFGDYDFLSANDAIGTIEGRYPGQMPFEVRGKVGAASCYAIPPDGIAAERARWQAELAAAIHGFEAHVPTLDAPVPWAQAERAETALGALEYFAGKDEQAQREVIASLEERSRKQWSRYLELLREKRKATPAPDTWVSLGDDFDGRVAGLHCQTGDQLIPICDPALELQLKKDAAPPPDCHDAPSFLDRITPVELMDHRGERASALFNGIRLNGVWVTSEADLWKAKKGDRLFIPLSGGGLSYRKTNRRYDIPFVVVNKTYLRIY